MKFLGSFMFLSVFFFISLFVINKAAELGLDIVSIAGTTFFFGIIGATLLYAYQRFIGNKNIKNTRDEK